ncbi:MAG: radical SAM protein [Nitrospirae bacterium]|nr:radical SAM protein [Nitrospirota bacterium]
MIWEKLKNTYKGNSGSEGYVETVDTTGFSGWAYNKKTPDSPVELEIYDSSTHISTIKADTYRKDLEKAGKGNGCHAFSFKFPLHLIDNKNHDISVKISNTDYFLNNTPFTINIPIDSEGNYVFEGYVEAVDTTGLSGWVYFIGTPDTHVEIEIYDSSTHISTIKADTYRQDLEKAGKGDGCHAFSFKFPLQLKDDKNHDISVKISNTDYFLNNSPFTINIPIDSEENDVFEGYVEAVEISEFSGWAYNKKTPDSPVEIEIYDSSTLIGTIKADAYRRDLEKAEIGNGCHGFRFKFPPHFVDKKNHEISVKIADTDYFLKNSPFTIYIPTDIDFISIDITNNCNLRCPFCLVDRRGLVNTDFMLLETFKKAIMFLPYLPVASFYLSCLHEPTLHPDLAKFLEIIPLQWRNRVFFTTNLAANLSDDILIAMSKSGIHHINISVDTLNPSLYPKLRKGGIYKRFMNNIERLTSFFYKEPLAPELHFITVALKSNMSEIPDIVAQCANKYLSVSHEVRYPFNVNSIDDTWRKDNFITEATDWDVIANSLKDISANYVLCRPEDGYYDTFASSVDYYETGQHHMKATPPEKPIQLRIDHRGVIRVLTREEYFYVNIHILNNPMKLFTAFF